MEIKNINTVKSDEIDNTKATNQVQTPTDAINTSVDQEKHIENTNELHKTKAQRKHSIIYLAGGIWCDSTGTYWCRDTKKNCISSIVLTDDEFNTRGDIKYMIQYGAMKDIISE